MRYISSGLLLLLAMFCFCGCGSAGKNKTVASVRKTEAVVLIDVRSAEEFASGHLQGSINIPHTEIADRIAVAVPDKSTVIRLYCRSGRRVKVAMETLRNLNYNNLEDHGSINDAARQLALPVVKD